MTGPPVWSTPSEATVLDRLALLERTLNVAGDRFEPAAAAAARRLVERSRQRLGHSSAHTVVAVAGGTGSGKSSLFNAMVGLPLSPVGVRRPVTEEPIACVWGEAGPAEPQAAALLDWVGIAPRARLSRSTTLDPRPDPQLEGLVLIDLPDHDTVRLAHVEAVDRVVAAADLVIWVVDPQKYADEALHGRYLSRLGGQDGAVAVVMNQLDRVEASLAATLGGDLRRLLAQDGLGSAAVVAASAATGGGLPALRGLLVDRVTQRRQFLVRIAAELSGTTAALLLSLGAQPKPVTRAETDALLQGLLAAVPGEAMVERLMTEDRLSEPVLISQNHVERAVFALVEPILAPLPPAWQRHGEQLVGSEEVTGAIAAALSTVDGRTLGPRGLRRALMRRERAEALRREAVRTAVQQVVAAAAAETVLAPLSSELARWTQIESDLTAVD